MRRLPPEFFGRDATVVAPELLHTVVVVGGVRARITEVEAYTQDDEASHSFRGVTQRNAAMFGPPGMLYVYLIYGMHHCINVVTGEPDDGQAVLIRGAVVDGVDARLTNGPGKLARMLGVDLSWNGTPAEVFTDGSTPAVVEVTPRIGITKAAALHRRWAARWIGH